MVDTEIVAEKIKHIGQYTSDLKGMRGLSRDQYCDDMVIQRAVERTLMNLIQACIDLAEHIRSSEMLQSDGTSKSAIEALESAAIISDETKSKMEEAVGFRNFLAHRYGDIDNAVVYDVLQEDLHWFERFRREIAQWFETRTPN